MTPFTRPSIEMAVASQVSPTGANAAGRHGLGLLSIGATSTGGFNALASNWAIAEESARDAGTRVDRANWRLVGPMHIAETREQARADVAFGLRKWLYYFTDVAALPMAVDTDADPVDALIATGLAVVGTPDDAIAQIERLEKQSGGFGCYLSLDHNWADWDKKQRSYELLARYVFPRFQGSNINREQSLGWARDNRPAFVGELFGAMGARVARHIEDKGAQNIAPEVMEAMGLNKKPDAAE
jgi:limonene 1,2-monooxygenase